jgi:hypothetical protein
MARRGPGGDPKAAALREARCLNRHPGQVSDAAFLAEEFSGARDVVQVKYEMVRAVTVDKVPVTAAAAAFGYSRPSYYQAAAALAGSGLEGLVPVRPGPRRAHKLTAEILAWAEQALAAGPALRPSRPGRADRGELRRARAPPVHRASAGPAPGTPPRKPLTYPPAHRERRSTRPRPRRPHLATRLPSRAPARMPARSPPPVPGWMPATSNCATPPRTHAPRRSPSAQACSPARASPPGGAPCRPDPRRHPASSPGAPGRRPGTARRRPRAHRRGQQLPGYVCQRSMAGHADQICQALPGASPGAAIGQLITGTPTPLAVEAALTVTAEPRAARRLRQPATRRRRRPRPLPRRPDPPPLPGRRPRQPPRRRHPGSRLEHRAARTP